MSIYIHNSLTRKKEEFIPLKAPRVNIYTCGVTVYDDCHIGHVRSLYIFDIIRKYLKYRGFDVRFVRNITDIDDKIINRSQELGLRWDELVSRHIASYYQDVQALGIGKADYEPRATENILDMIEYIKKLIDKGYAYITETGVYFSVRKSSGYGKLSGQSIDQILSGTRKEPDETKEDVLDFALWKKSKEGEPSWDSPWGKGRPGWHIECSVMSQKFLNTETLDIHAGGRDLIFPHHENEIAQAEAVTGKFFARYWIHHGLLTINGQKMSKSLGNFVTVKDFLAKYKDPNLLKLFFLSTHYSHPIDYNEEKIEESRKQRKSFYDFFDKVNFWRLKKGRRAQATSEKDASQIESVCARFEQVMDDDFNTPQALASLFDLIDLASGFVSCDKQGAFVLAKKKLEGLFSIFGLTPKGKQPLPQEVEGLIRQREEARKNDDFQTADNIRSEIEARFRLTVMDTAAGVTFVEDN